jgi:hypothetical protein
MPSAGGPSDSHAPAVAICVQIDMSYPYRCGGPGVAARGGERGPAPAAYRPQPRRAVRGGAAPAHPWAVGRKRQVVLGAAATAPHSAGGAWC